MLTKVFFILVLLVSCHSAIAQEKTKKNRKQNTPAHLSIQKSVPLYIAEHPLNTCNVKNLIHTLQDSLAAEGFKVIDSIKRMSMTRSFFRTLMDVEKTRGKSPDQVKAYMETTMRTTKVYQDLLIRNNSCSDTLHNYTITVYLFPRPHHIDEKNSSFTLPFDSPERIIDVVLSMIERRK